MNKLTKVSIYFLSILLVCIDQIIKFLVVRNLDKFPIQIIKNFINLNYCENRGAAFSIGNGQVSLFIVLNIFLIGGLIIFYEKNKKEFNKFSKTSLIFIISGGFSNLLDRIFRGFVVDYIDVSEFIHFPVFNLADIFIVIGVIGLILLYIKELLKNGNGDGSVFH